MYTYAKINKETLRYIRVNKSVTVEHIERITKYKKQKILEWEDVGQTSLPTINQAKAIAKCLHVPFAGLYMNSNDIPQNKLPKITNMRTLPNSISDESALYLAITDLILSRDLLIETKKELGEKLPLFNISIESDDPVSWAIEIRKRLNLSKEIQYKCKSPRQFYLLVRELIEDEGVFIHCFSNVDTEVARGLAIYYEIMPIIGINDDDRYPAKTFSIIHELVHVIKRSSMLCNELYSAFSKNKEEVFCNTVAGEVLVPRKLLVESLKDNSTNKEITLGVIEDLAIKFSVSKEVIIRRLYDLDKISQQKYNDFADQIKANFEQEREIMKVKRKESGAKGIPRNILRETVDRTSPSLSKTLYHGLNKGIIDKQDISRYLGIGMKHIDRFIAEVSRWAV